MPENFNKLLSLFDTIADKGLETEILDYYVLEKRIPILVAQGIINDIHRRSQEGGRKTVEDELQLIRGLGTLEEYKKREQEDQCVNQRRFEVLVATQE